MEITDIIKKLISQPAEQHVIKQLKVSDSTSGFHVFSNNSRYFDGLVWSYCQVTSSAGKLYICSNNLSNAPSGPATLNYQNETLTELHKHNYVELAYVAEGELHQDISGKHEVFRSGEICLMGKDTLHAEYLYTEHSVVMFLGISNSFFDKSIRISVEGLEEVLFIRNIIMKAQDNFRFIRCVPKQKESQTSFLFGQILAELTHRQTGSMYLIIGYVERLLNQLPVEYELRIEKQSVSPKDELFNDIQRYLGQNYQQISLTGLADFFHYNADYLNRFIKNCTGMTYSHFLQHIRLEKPNRSLKLPITR
jgi:AraC-like DNA-binding protein/ethanolamine utilization protein EutQ (cupin superfamily)